MNFFDLTGKAAVVTGSSRGIGKAIATALAMYGARVVVSSRKAERCAEAVRSINETVGADRAISIPATISSKEELTRLIEATQQQLGAVDILVCNAATNPHFGSMSALSDDAFRKILENNILATHWLAQLVIPGMVARKDGVIIFVSSIGAMRGSSNLGAYNVSKAADLQLARNLAVEYGPHNIRVNCICPGLIKTDFSQELWKNSERLANVERLTPLRRIGTPNEIGGAAVFLASPAGAFITGQEIVIDGGSTIVSNISS